MALRTHVFKRGPSYYHRIRVPQPLRQMFGRDEFTRSLRTSNAERAQIIGALLTRDVVRLFRLVKRDMNKFSQAEVEDLARALYARLLDQDTKDRYDPHSAFDWRKDFGSSERMEELADGEDPAEFIKRSGRSAFELLKDDEDLLDLEYWETTTKNRDFRETDFLVSMPKSLTCCRVVETILSYLRFYFDCRQKEPLAPLLEGAREYL